ncbi:Retrovirus-related Pol polyprotein from type-1 retrotransposable element R1 [Eumeta japonica]|uniref:Retrovirus-related Pol polyprotein from type-1 retrotransposable element R1 n=1 Tax=Eumeta variegata TaxID=151549 RepID=A0A4C1VTY0_EUMVA|nr:Retrovirus-related Pol polyprotein from type-1 retrotransposable element R1 [Eumeta japonica]
MEGFICGLGLVLHNREGQTATFAGPRGESNVDLTLTTRGVIIEDWTMHVGTSSSDHRLIAYRVGGAEKPVARAQPAGEPARFRDRRVDWSEFESVVYDRIGCIPWGAPAAVVAESFTDVIIRSGRACLGERKMNEYYGYEWWNAELELLRRTTARKRKVWQKSRSVERVRESTARSEFLVMRSRYRRTMRKSQTIYYKRIAESGNDDP